jgi:hypothetical protein
MDILTHMAVQNIVNVVMLPMANKHGMVHAHTLDYINTLNITWHLGL